MRDVLLWRGADGGAELQPADAPNAKLTGLTGAYIYVTAAALAAKGRVDGSSPDNARKSDGRRDGVPG